MVIMFLLKIKIMKNWKLEKLQNGETFTTSERGNSMVPLIKSGQEHRLEPATVESVEVGDIVYAKVKGKWYILEVKSIYTSGLSRSSKSGWFSTLKKKIRATEEAGFRTKVLIVHNSNVHVVSDILNKTRSQVLRQLNP